MRLYLLASAVILAAQATIRYVEIGGLGETSTGCDAALPCNNVQDALQVAQNGDVIQIGAGSFSGKSTHCWFDARIKCILPFVAIQLVIPGSLLNISITGVDKASTMLVGERTALIPFLIPLTDPWPGDLTVRHLSIKQAHIGTLGT